MTIGILPLGPQDLLAQAHKPSEQTVDVSLQRRSRAPRRPPQFRKLSVIEGAPASSAAPHGSNEPRRLPITSSMRRRLRDRLLWRVPAASARPLEDPEMMARAALYLLGISGVAGFAVTLAFPPPGAQVDPLAFAPAAGCLVLGAIVLMAFDRLPLWSLQAIVAGGTALTSVSFAMGGERAAGAEAFYLWTALYAGLFFTPSQAMAQVAVVALGYGAAMAANPPGGEPLAHWLLVVLGVTMVAIVVCLLKRGVDGLVARLASAARTDPLTCLLNRRGFSERLEVELARAERNATPLSVVVGDLDAFKAVNDQLGHYAGDRALERLGELLRDHGRPVDTAARIGGEEFALLLPETGAQQALLVAERLRARVQAGFAGDPLPLTISFGIAAVPEHGSTGEQVLGAADRALYAAKESGRNRSLIHTAEVAQILQARRRDPRTQLQLATAIMLAEALDLRDAGTARHSETVAGFAEQMASELALPPEQVERVRLAGLLHDVGKIGVSDAVLRKPGKHTDEEWLEMRRHPEIGARLLPGDALEDIRAWVVAHHERPDGNGYPRGLAGEAIPLEARILAIADAYEAMIADRPYRVGIPPAAARAELARCSGTQFDAHVVRAFLRSLGGTGALAA